MSPTRLSIVLASAFAALLVGAATRDGNAATVRVMVRPALSLEAHVQGALVEVKGTVRDPVGRPLASLPLQIGWTGADQTTSTTTATTDETGSFQVRRILADGDWQIAARYAGNAYLSSAESALSIRSERAPLDLQCAVPRFVALDAPEIIVRCDVLLDGAAWTATPVELRSDCANIVPADDGVAEASWHWWVEPHAAGECSVVAVAAASDVHAGASVEHSVRFIEGATLDWRAEPAPLQRVLGPRYTAHGVLRDAAGPLAGAAVHIAAGGVAASTATGDDGQFSAVLDLSGLEVGTYPADAVFRADLPHNAVLAMAGPLQVQRPRGVSEIVVLVGAILLVAVAALVSWAYRPARGLLRKVRRGARPAPVGPIEPLPVAEAARALLVVLDASTGKRVPDADIRVFAEAGTEPTFHAQGAELRLAAASGRFRIEANAPGYLPHLTPHTTLDAGSRTVLRLVPVRIHVRDQVHALLDDLELRNAEHRWGRATVSSMRSALRSGLRALRRERAPERVVSVELERLLDVAQGTPPDPVAAAEALVLVLDRVWWQRDPAAADAALADALVAQVRAAAARRRG